MAHFRESARSFVAAPRNGAPYTPAEVVIGTPDRVRAMVDQLDRLVFVNEQGSHRQAGIIDEAAKPGASSVMNGLIRSFDRSSREEYGARTATGHQRIPVLEIELRSNTTLHALCNDICRFYQRLGVPSADSAQLAEQALTCIASSGTRLCIVSNAHRLHHGGEPVRKVAAFLNSLSDYLPVTVVYSGVGVARHYPFAVSLRGSPAAEAQLARGAVVFG